MVFHNDSNYDFHFITNELAEEIEGQFTCVEGNTEKKIHFSDPIKKRNKKHCKKGKEIKVKTIS